MLKVSDRLGELIERRGKSRNWHQNAGHLTYLSKDLFFFPGIRRTWKATIMCSANGTGMVCQRGSHLNNFNCLTVGSTIFSCFYCYCWSIKHVLKCFVFQNLCFLQLWFSVVITPPVVQFVVLSVWMTYVFVVVNMISICFTQHCVNICWYFIDVIIVYTLCPPKNKAWHFWSQLRQMWTDF